MYSLDLRLRNIFKSIGDGVITINMDRKIDFINEVAMELVGCSSEEAVGQRFREIFKLTNSLEIKEDCIVCESISRKAVMGLPKGSQLVSKTGQLYYISASVSPIVCDTCPDGLDGVVVVFRDITRIIEMQEATDRAKSDFLANMTHELKTPLNGIVGMLDLARLTDLNEEQSDYLSTAKSCANNLLSLVQDLLDFSKMEAGIIEIHNSPFLLEQMISDLEKIHGLEAKGKKLKFEIIDNLKCKEVLYGDGKRLTQVLNNLLSNAIKFTDFGGVTFTISGEKNDDSVDILFKVSDTGLGIREEDKNKLFKRFSQIEDYISKKHKGTGLGLVISKGLVEGMKGNIWFESEAGMGSDFMVNISFPFLDPSIDYKMII